jgi:hypothetical protein
MDAEAFAGRDAATTVGLITLPIGVALVAAPAQATRLLRFGDDPRALRAIGAADLALVPGLLAGRHRWQWMAARVGLNLAIAAYCLRLARRERAAGAKAGALAMVVASLDDGRRIAALRRARSPG